MRDNLSKLLFVLFTLTSTITYADPGTPWNLPAKLSDQNSKITFEVDSTWHTVHGTTQGITGFVWLDDPSDYRSVKARVTLPVRLFDTDNSMRDERMLEVMAEEQYKEVSFELSELKDICNPVTLKEKEGCKAQAIGTISIRGVKEELQVPVVVNHKDKQYKITGDFSVDWSTFGVEDPSILIAKLDKVVKIELQIIL